MAGDTRAAASMFAEAANIAQRSGDLDLMNFARHAQGRALVEVGEIERGVALLDEVMVAVTAGEVSPITAGIVYCSVLSVCWDMFDVGRAREWTEAFRVWCESQPDLVLYRGECLVNHAGSRHPRRLVARAREALLACERLAGCRGSPRRRGGLPGRRAAPAARGFRSASNRSGPPTRPASVPGARAHAPGAGTDRRSAAAISRVLEETRSRRAVACTAAAVESCSPRRSDGRTACR
jgi:hypothetical protein